MYTGVRMPSRHTFQGSRASLHHPPASTPPPPADPTKAFYQFAAQKRFDKKVKGLSLGQGQGLKAARLIEEATQKGTWVSAIPCFRCACFYLLLPHVSPAATQFMLYISEKQPVAG